jgi:hypothetical protein
LRIGVLKAVVVKQGFQLLQPELFLILSLVLCNGKEPVATHKQVAILARKVFERRAVSIRARNEAVGKVRPWHPPSAEVDRGPCGTERVPGAMVLSDGGKQLEVAAVLHGRKQV